MIKNETTNLVSQVQCQRWGSWGEMHSMWKDKVRGWFLQDSKWWPRGFSWRSRPGLISLLTHQCTLTHCLRCNSGCRGWRGRSIDLSGGRKVIIVWSQPFKLQSFSSFIVLCLLDILIGLTAYFEVWSEASSEGHWSREEGKRSSDPGDWLKKCWHTTKTRGEAWKALELKLKSLFRKHVAEVAMSLPDQNR